MLLCERASKRLLGNGAHGPCSLIPIWAQPALGPAWIGVRAHLIMGLDLDSVIQSPKLGPALPM